MVDETKDSISCDAFLLLIERSDPKQQQQYIFSPPLLPFHPLIPLTSLIFLFPTISLLFSLLLLSHLQITVACIHFFFPYIHSYLFETSLSHVPTFPLIPISPFLPFIPVVDTLRVELRSAGWRRWQMAST